MESDGDVVDVVTERLANLHNEIMQRLGHGERGMTDVPIYATAYRPVRTEDGGQLEVWAHALALVATLPTLPLALRNAATVGVDPERAYSRTRRVQRLG